MSGKKILIALLALIAVYAIAGFIVLPLWLEKAVPERLAQHMGWQATVDEIRVNPFAISVEALNLQAKDSDGERVAGFDRLYVNVALLRMATGVIELENFEVDTPFARVDLRDDYSVNFANDWQANNPATDEAPASKSEASEPVRLFLERFRISGGEVLLRDFSHTTAEDGAAGQPVAKEFRISPLDLSLNDLSTWPREDRESDYYLLAAIGDQTVEWEGDLSLAPFYSNGFLKVADVSHETLAHFLAPYVPYGLTSGRLTVRSNYEMQSGDQFSLVTSEGEVTLTDAKLAMPDGDDILQASRIYIPDVQFGLNQREFSAGTVAIEETQVTLERNSEGQLRLLSPFQNDETQVTQDNQPEGNDQPNNGSQASPFRWSIAGVKLTDSQVNWRDEQPEPAADLTAEKLNVTLGRLSHELGNPVDYQAELSLAAGGSMNARGQVTLQPFTLEAGIGVSNILLSQFDPYVGEATNLAIYDGLLSLDGNLDMDNQKDPMTGTFSGSAQVAGVDLRLGESEEPVLAWKNLRFEPIEYNLAPARLEIGTLTLSEPNVRVIREADGEHNLARIVPASNESAGAEEPEVSAVDNSEESTAAAAETNGAEKTSFIFRIGQIMLEEGVVAYTDRSLDPVFSTQLDKLNGSVTGLSNVSPQQGKVSLRGRIGDVASLRFDGSIGALGTDDTSDLKLKIDGVALPALSPYLSRYLGYGVANGKLDMNLDYQLTGSKINAENHILLDRMELGSSVESDDAVDAPVKLGLALLKDRKGVIDIDLPIEGDLEDPDFRIGRVVMRTFVNLVAKAATSPFSVLGSIADMAGLTGEELGQVSFQPGKTELAQGDREKLEVLSSVLDERPSLLLKVRGSVSPSADGDFLRRQRLFEELAIGDAPSAQARVAKLEQAYQAFSIEQPLDAFRSEVANAQGGSLTDAAWEKALVNELLPTVELPPEALGGLASDRGAWLQQTLKNEYDVPDEQLFLLEPAQDAETDDEGKVRVQFELEAR